MSSMSSVLYCVVLIYAFLIFFAGWRVFLALLAISAIGCLVLFIWDEKRHGHNIE